jgi:CheY-like chemotaxis protein
MGQMPRILVVDDEPDQRFLLRRIFEGAGYEVAEAEDGSAALGVIRESPPDLLVTDMTMPVMTGPELIRCVRAEPAMAHIPILAVSGDPQLAGDADAILPKPYYRHDLIAVADGLLKEGRGSR